jgi:folate-binding Fe-S cluster repair protein YgfZ
MTTLFDTAAHLDRLADWGVLSAQGEDATRFLQGQLTNDVALMPEGTARLSGYCSAKGR